MCTTSKLIETGGGYTFYCIGQPDGKARQYGVGFVVRNTIASKLVADPVGNATRLMTLELCLPHGQRATLLSAYAPTMLETDDANENFYIQLEKKPSLLSHSNTSFSSLGISTPMLVEISQSGKEFLVVMLYAAKMETVHCFLRRVLSMNRQ